MSDAHTEANNIGVEPSAEVVPSPRFSIAHLIAWQVIMALFLAVRISVYYSRSDEPLSTTVSEVIDLVVDTISLAAILEWFLRRFRSIPFPQQPGEWLWAASGCSVVVVLVSELIELTQTPTNDLIAPTDWNRIISSLRCCVSAIICGVGFAVLKNHSLWRAVLAVKCIMSIYASIIFLLLGLSMLGVTKTYFYSNAVIWTVDASPAVVCLLAVIVDAVRKRKMRWAHWAGVFVLLVPTLIDVFSVLTPNAGR